jgi:uncharacterized protein YcbK (DUF882 family)
MGHAPAFWRFVVAASLACGIFAGSSDASADIEHTVQRGHTLEAIANRYHVSKKAIIDANHLKPNTHLRVGETLIIPGVNEKAPTVGATGASKGKTDGHGKLSAISYVARPKSPGVVHITRIAMREDYTVRVNDRRGRQSPAATKQFEKLMRSPNAGATHPIDPRLIALVGVVSDHFGGRKVEVISGYRPYTPTQYTPHSNHNHGRAIDFRVVGVPNEVVRDYCRTLRNTGCGYYPNSVFVHMDVRDRSAYWIDFSKPGEPPRYNSPNVDADEGATDVHRESPAENGMPAVEEAPPAPTPTDSPAPTQAPAQPQTMMLTPTETTATALTPTATTPTSGATPPTPPVLAPSASQPDARTPTTTATP